MLIVKNELFLVFINKNENMNKKVFFILFQFVFQIAYYKKILKQNNKCLLSLLLKKIIE